MNLNLFTNKKVMGKTFLYMISAALLAVSCNTVRIQEPVQYGTLAVSLSGDPVIEVVSKADETLTSAQAAGYNVAVYTSADCSGTPVVGPVRYSELTSPVVLPAATYYVWAESCTAAEAEAGNGTMRFEGVSEAVEVTPGFASTATVGCTVANAVVTVNFDDSVDGKITDLKVTLVRETPSRSVEVAYSDDAKQQVWFNAESTVRYTISGTSAITGQPLSGDGCTGILPVLKARNNVQLNVRVASTDGKLTVSADIETSVPETTVNPEGFNPYN